jgi:predicted acetyltransferase
MLELINESNSNIFDKLVQDYEDEFSSITGKKKNQDGKYSIDVNWHIPNIGYYWREDSNILGFCIVDSVDGYSDIAEFYVIPAYRKNKIGQNMAFAVFNQHLGPWQVRQILGAELAKRFWRRVINEYTNGNYAELQMDDPTWGQVVCQRFTCQN